MEVVVPKFRKDGIVPFMSIKDAATATGLSQFYIRNGCKDGSVPHIKSGNQYMVNVPLLIEELNRASVRECQYVVR